MKMKVEETLEEMVKRDIRAHYRGPLGKNIPWYLIDAYWYNVYGIKT